ncbi:flippase-like domain-containing protein [Dysgonomonas sp. Marseille-P4677]|uniref:lysylphosphatidylglycerol synthase transmembrane domain-containing protein n=1 Tax=Dysgonomonas sp. Marseille-P4677 TaxID=2364790 RepID=UPI001912F391|nr:lysylphosphatidylglycerol synthase transmembrane domain-containing protein [Dysgonomonas sp. Marseille-P4677]MBK5719290.1 flippase-like domain-containing protein [Dysgonomonas sp. Marseille-P4677]
MGKEIQGFSIWKVLLPTFIGLGVIAYMFSREFNLSDLKQISITGHTVFWIIIAFCFMLGRDAGFTIRYRYLTEKQLSWKQCIKVTLLAEFGTAITPSVVGGSSMAVVFLAKESIPVGRSTMMVFVTLLLDEMFFIVTFPILLFCLPFHTLFANDTALGSGVLILFIVAYIIKMALCTLLIIGLFFKPQTIRWLIIKIFRLPFLRRWHKSAVKVGDDIIVSSREIRGKRKSYWIPLITATILSWCSRYLVVNAIFMAFFEVHDNLLIFARQFVMWVVMVVSPTPGGSGFTEFIFKQYLSEFIPLAGIVPVVILLWRLLTYYNYLLVGALIVPGWIKKSFGKKDE